MTTSIYNICQEVINAMGKKAERGTEKSRNAILDKMRSQGLFQKLTFEQRF